MTMFLFDGWTLLTVLGVFAIWNSVRHPFDMSSPPTCSRGLVNFSASELKHLNCQPGSRLMPSTYLRYVELGILRRSRYVHWGSRSSCPVSSANPGSIPVVWSTKRHASCRNQSQCGVSLDSLRSLSKTALYDSSLLGKNVMPLKMALINARSITNKTFLLIDFFSSNNLDFLFVTETWLTPEDRASLSELCPTNSNYLSCPRTFSRGGGVAVIFKNVFSCRPLPIDAYSSFEALVCEVDLSEPLLCALIYRAPKSNKYFLTEFSDFLSILATKADNFLLLGDFNVHVCCPQKPLVR